MSEKKKSNTPEEKLDVIRLLVDPKKFNTNDIELLRESIQEVLDRDE